MQIPFELGNPQNRDLILHMLSHSEPDQGWPLKLRQLREMAKKSLVFWVRAARPKPPVKSS